MTSAALTRHLKCIAADHEILESPSPIHLGAFFYGYLSVVPDLSWVIEALDAQFAGPAQARAWTRAYLAFGDEAGLTRVIDAAVTLLEDSARPVAAVGSSTSEMFVDVVLAAVRANRPAMVLGESTMPWLYNFGLGAHAADEDYFPALASQRRAKLLGFEAWLQNCFNAPGVPWQRILRAFEGPGERAVYSFASLWDEYQRA
ncbi:MAG: hypothetical protein ABIQ16_04325 [Polyangiaceae bacterium]